MTNSLLKEKPFFCREWAFSKIHHCLEHRATAKTCGALIMGGQGCGKTALSCEMIWPTTNHGRQVSLSKRALAYYFCQAHDIETLSIATFIHCLVDQISKSTLLSHFQELLEDPAVQAALDPVECERNPDQAFEKGVLLPLLAVNPPPQNLYILVDSIDESYMQAISQRTSGSRTISELLANHHQMFPRWLLLVCSARKQSKSVTRLFTGFRKISLDDLRKTHVVRDVQQYILCRLDQEDQLRQHLSRETAEMLNQLHIKSNGSFLYLQKVLDGVAESFIMLREIREIPGTLNGLYLWLCQRLFVRKQFSKIQPILNVILAARRPLTEMELYSCAYTRNTTLTYDEFKRRLKMLEKILIDGRDGTKILFHHSFAEWLLDVKHCTKKYLCEASEGHGMLAMSFTMHAASLTPIEIQDFALHMVRSNMQPPLDPYHLALWLIQSGGNVDDSLSPGLPKDHVVLKLLMDAGARPLYAADLAASVAKPVVAETSDPVNEILNTDVDVNETDSNGRTMLSKAAYEGDVVTVEALIARGAGLEIEDKTGQTALNLSARQGHPECVSGLLKGGAHVDHCDHDGWTALRASAWGGHTEVVGLLLDSGAEVDHPDSDQRTALRAAAWGGHENIVLKLLEYGASVNQVDNEGRTALIAAAYMGHTEIVEHLLDHSANINHEDIDGRTALSVAALCIPASEGHSGVVSLLLERGAEVDHQDKDGMTPLLVAAYEGHRDVCELLLEYDADVDHTDNNNRTPLQATASMGHSTVVNLLLFWGAAVDAIDADGRTVLCLGSQQGNVDVVRQLLERGLDEMHRDNGGWTPLHMAAFEGHKEVVEALIESGARVTEVDNDGRIPLILAAQEGHLPVVASLLASGSPLEARAHDGKTSLRVAALEGHKDVVQYLLGHSVDVNYRDADGRSTLYVLALENHLSMAALILEEGPYVEGCDLEGRTPLHVSSWQGHYEMTELLLNNGADVNAVDNDSRTALQSAAWQGHANIVRLLLDRSAEVDRTCNQGATALCIAAQEGHRDVVRVLLQFGANPNHADQFGRTATRVALKGGHSSVVKIIEEFGAQHLNGINGRRSVVCNNTTHATSSMDSKAYNSSQIEAHMSSLPVRHTPATPPLESPASTGDRRKSYHSNNSKSSSNLTSSNTASTNQSSCSGGGDINSPAALTFTQQLQQCSSARHRHRPISRLLSPVSEPQSPGQSPPGSPMSEVQSVRVSPDVQSPSSLRVASPRREGNDSSGGSPMPGNPSAEQVSTGSSEEPIWQKQPDSAGSHSNLNVAKLEMQRKGSLPEGHSSMSAMVMGQTALQMKSPESRRKRNGIVTNPNFAKGVNINGYYNQLANLAEGMDNFAVANGNAQGTNGSQRAKRPNGLPIKKETPL